MKNQNENLIGKFKNYDFNLPSILLICLFLLLFVSNAYGQQQSAVVTGVVRDAMGQILPGVSVVEEGTTNGTVTDFDGKYKINVSANSVLVYSYIGMKTQKVVVDSRSVIDVMMVEEAFGLSEVVAIGYGKQKKATLTGAIATVNIESLEKVPSVNLSNTFAGRLPGLVALNRSGEPGADFSSLLIRGTSTLGNNSPLIVIDGVAGRGGLNTINPRDIESVSVLKDASAAIYGAQAANGVILVTTKRGKTGKPTISYSGNQGILQPTRMPKMADAATYAEFVNYQLGLFNQSPQYSPEDIQMFRDGSSPISHPSTDWIDETISDFSLQSQHNLSISGGTDKVKYFVAGNASNQDGIFKNGEHNYKVWGLRSNIDVNITDDLIVSVDLSISDTDRLRPNSSAQEIIQTAYRGYPTLLNTLPNGSAGYALGSNQNPTVMATDVTGYISDKGYLNQNLLSFKYSIPTIAGLGIDGRIAYDKQHNYSKNWNLPYTLYAYDSEDNSYTGAKAGPASPELRQSSSFSSKVDANLRLTYDYEKQDHKLNTFIAYEQQENKYNFIEAYRRDYSSSAIDQIFAGSEVNMQTDGSATPFARRNYFGRISYGFKNKYLIDFNARYDGSTNFPKENRYGFFPGISASWVLSEENFLKKYNFINQLKFRASWGQMGNDLIDPFQYLATYDLTRGAFFGTDRQLKQGVRSSVEPNENVTWEVANTTNIGFDATLWQGKLTATADVFKTKRSNILGKRNASIPSFTGLVLPDENIGIVENKGFEIAMSHRNSLGGNKFNYSINGNLSYARNNVIFVDEAVDRSEWQKAEGLPLNSDLYYSAIGIYRSQQEIDNSPHPPGTRVGDLQYEDVNDDGIINAIDRRRLDKTPVPEIVYGGGFSLQYGGFDLDIFFQGQGRAWKYFYMPQGTFGNVIKEMAENVPGPDNPNSKYPNLYSDEGEVGAWESDFWLYNASFLRLKSAEIGFNLPSNIISKLHLNSARLYINGLNLLTFDKLDFIDPEGDANRGSHYPQNRIFNLGVDISF